VKGTDRVRRRSRPIGKTGRSRRPLFSTCARPRWRRPITAAQVIAFACAVGLLGACFGATSTWFQSALGRITSSVVRFEMNAFLPSATALLAEHSALVIAMTAVIFLVPAAVYLAILRD
jgi:hypothetical protein